METRYQLLLINAHTSWSAHFLFHCLERVMIHHGVANNHQVTVLVVNPPDALVVILAVCVPQLELKQSPVVLELNLDAVVVVERPRRRRVRTRDVRVQHSRFADLPASDNNAFNVLHVFHFSSSQAFPPHWRETAELHTFRPRNYKCEITTIRALHISRIPRLSGKHLESSALASLWLIALDRFVSHNYFHEHLDLDFAPSGVISGRFVCEACWIEIVFYFYLGTLFVWKVFSWIVDEIVTIGGGQKEKFLWNFWAKDKKKILQFLSSCEDIFDWVESFLL